MADVVCKPSEKRNHDIVEREISHKVIDLKPYGQPMKAG